MSLQNIEAFDRALPRTDITRTDMSATKTTPFGEGVPFGDVRPLERPELSRFFNNEMRARPPLRTSSSPNAIETATLTDDLCSSRARP